MPSKTRHYTLPHMDPDFDPLAPPPVVLDTQSDEDDNDSIDGDKPERAPIPRPSSPVTQEPERSRGTTKDTILDPNESEIRPKSNESRPKEVQSATSRKLSVTSITQERPVADEDRPFDFPHFMDQMRTKSAVPISRYIKSFIYEFQKKNWTVSEQVKIVNDFEVFIASRMRECPPFSALEKNDWDNSQEGIEKLIMNRLYPLTFPPKMAPGLRRQDHEDDLTRDRVFGEKLRVWSWIEPRHLDISPKCFENRSFLELACKQLDKINSYRAPRDKCICVLNCSKVIWALIRSAKIEANADSFLPILIYIILQAKPSYIISNVNYINRFRGPKHMRGETAYYMSMLQSAIAFIEGLDKSSLSIEDQEYQEKIEEAIKLEKQYTEPVNTSEQHHHRETNTPGSVLSVSAGLLVDSLKSYANKIFEPDEVEPTQQEQQPSSRREDRAATSPEELAARKASKEEYNVRLAQEQEFAQTLETLIQMFPTLDKEVIEDVLREKGTRLGAAIDICLNLCE